MYYLSHSNKHTSPHIMTCYQLSLYDRCAHHRFNLQLITYSWANYFFWHIDISELLLLLFFFLISWLMRGHRWTVLITESSKKSSELHLHIELSLSLDITVGLHVTVQLHVYVDLKPLKFSWRIKLKLATN